MTLKSLFLTTLLWVPFWTPVTGVASVKTPPIMDAKILGDWQLKQNNKVKYLSVFQNHLNQLRMVECEVGHDRHGTETEVIVCPASITAGLILKPFKENQFKVVTSGHAFTHIEVSDNELRQTGLFGYFSETWTRVDQNLFFVFGGK